MPCAPILAALLTLYQAAPVTDGPCVMGVFQNGAVVRLAADRVNVRSAPSLTGAVVATLPIGSRLRIASKSASSETIERLRAPWYKVSFGEGKNIKTGFVWGGLISAASFELTGAGGPALFLTAFSVTPEKNLSCRALLVRAGVVASRVEFQPAVILHEDGAFEYSITAELHPGRGLPGVTDLISLTFSYPACGYPFGTVLLMHDGSTIHYGASTQNMVEGGVFHLLSRIIYPDEKEGVKESLVIVTTNEEFNSDKSEYELVKTEKRVLRWTGKGFVEKR